MTAKVLGHQEDVDTYRAVANRARKGFLKRFLNTSDGTIANGSQTAQAAALYFKMVDDYPLTFIFDRLIDAIHEADFHIDTGILGARYLFRVLSDYGRTDIALRILRQKANPWGWLGALCRACRRCHIPCDPCSWLFRVSCRRQGGQLSACPSGCDWPRLGCLDVCSDSEHFQSASGVS